MTSYIEVFGTVGRKDVALRADLPGHEHDAGDITGRYGKITVGQVTLTGGGVIRTAPSGQRVEIQETSADRIAFWAGSGHAGEQPGQIYADSNSDGHFLTVGSPYDTAAGLRAYLNLFAHATAPFGRVGAHLQPNDDNTWNLGSSSPVLFWKALYAMGVYAANIYDESGNLRLDLNTVSYGANDSGGAGYKVVRVPN